MDEYFYEPIEVAKAPPEHAVVRYQRIGPNTERTIIAGCITQDYARDIAEALNQMAKVRTPAPPCAVCDKPKDHGIHSTRYDAFEGVRTHEYRERYTPFHLHRRSAEEVASTALAKALVNESRLDALEVQIETLKYEDTGLKGHLKSLQSGFDFLLQRAIGKSKS